MCPLLTLPNETQPLYPGKCAPLYLISFTALVWKTEWDEIYKETPVSTFFQPCLQLRPDTTEHKEPLKRNSVRPGMVFCADCMFQMFEP